MIEHVEKWYEYTPETALEFGFSQEEVDEMIERGIFSNSIRQEKNVSITGKAVDTLLSSMKAFTIALKQATGANQYKRDIWGAVQALWSGGIGRGDFTKVLRQLIPIAFERAWLDGAEAAGITSVDELTKDEKKALRERINSEKSYVPGFSKWVYEHRKSEGFKLKDLESRASMWWGRYPQVVDQARSMAMADQKTKWTLGPTEHCTDCAHVAGRVYRNSVWDDYGWVPGSSELECRGYRCQCSRVPTDDPVTPGRPPAMKGR